MAGSSARSRYYRGADGKRHIAPCEICGHVHCRCLEDQVVAQVIAAGLPRPVRWYPFAAPKTWKADLAFVDARVLVEVDGTSPFAKGGHSSPVGYADDCVKLAVANSLGWRVVRVNAPLIRDGVAIVMIRAALARAGPADILAAHHDVQLRQRLARKARRDKKAAK
jgi:hypothetical protein